MATSAGCRRLDAGDLPARRHPHGMTFPWAKSGAASTRLKPSSTRVDWDRLERLACSVRSPATSFAAKGRPPRGGNRYKAPFEEGLGSNEAAVRGVCEGHDRGVLRFKVGRRGAPASMEKG